jgi:hypothetical protein
LNRKKSLHLSTFFAAAASKAGFSLSGKRGELNKIILAKKGDAKKEKRILVDSLLSGPTGQRGRNFNQIEEKKFEKRRKKLFLKMSVALQQRRRGSATSFPMDSGWIRGLMCAVKKLFFKKNGSLLFWYDNPLQA